eukprot:maker-scaffold_5-snap-gene-13.5-mRNA-1 protein AED:0.00 eAED:0.00 QI:178/1/1/1/1/1/2/152/544
MALVCPNPLSVDLTGGVSANSIPDTGCSFACHGTMLDQDDLDRLNRVETALAGTSTVCALSLVLTWGLFSAKSKQKMTFWVSVCSLMVSVSIFIPALIKGTPQDVWCKSENEGFSQEDGFTLCVIQGILIIFFGLALCFWWWCSCFDLFSKLFRKKRNIQHYINYYHLLSWGIPGLFTVILLGTESYGFEQPRLWCFFDAASPSSYEFIFFYGWVGGLWFTGSVMMVLTFWSIFSQSRRMQSTRGRNKVWAKAKLYKTPIQFVFFFSFFWVVFFSFRLITVIDEDDYEDAAATWISCLIVCANGAINTLNISFPDPAAECPLAAFILDDDEAVGCGSKQPDGVPKGLLVIAVITISFQGILVFLVFGASYQNFRLWKDYLCGKSKPAETRYNSKTGNMEQVNYSKPKNTFSEIGAGIVALVTCGYCRGTANRQPLSQAHYHTQPKLRFTHAENMNPNRTDVQSTYVPKYYNNQQQLQNFPATTYAPQNYYQQYPQAQQQGQYPPGLVPAQEPFPGNFPMHVPNSPGSAYSDDPYDPLWGVNVAF